LDRSLDGKADGYTIVVSDKGEADAEFSEYREALFLDLMPQPAGDRNGPDAVRKPFKSPTLSRSEPETLTGLLFLPMLPYDHREAKHRWQSNYQH
jgi:hypothetical protein